jgi:hypothetical protein
MHCTTHHTGYNYSYAPHGERCTLVFHRLTYLLLPNIHLFFPHVESLKILFIGTWTHTTRDNLHWIIHSSCSSRPAQSYSVICALGLLQYVFWRLSNVHLFFKDVLGANDTTRATINRWTTCRCMSGPIWLDRVIGMVHVITWVPGW